MKYLYKILILLAFALLSSNSIFAVESSQPNDKAKPLNVRDFILEHIADSYEWHITTFNDKQIAIPLPVIVHSSITGWHVFLSSELHQQHPYGLFIPSDGKFKGKIVEKDASGVEVRPLDLSVTKVALSLIISGILLIIIIMSVAKSYRNGVYESKKGFVGFMELLIMNIHDDVIKPAVGEKYRHFAPYLLTLFFFVFVNNLLGLIPLFPGGANVTGNIAITFGLAVITFLLVNVFGTKEYWREILWPDVPLWLKVPVPLMPLIELVGIFSKPFALMIRLFANMLAGHSIVLGLTSLIFVTVSMGVAMNTSMTIVSVLFSVFIGFVEILVAYIQAYIFVMLSAVFIGLAQVKSHHNQ